MKLHPEHNSVSLKDEVSADLQIIIENTLQSINEKTKQQYTLHQLDQRCIELNYAICESAGFDTSDMLEDNEIGIICMYLLNEELEKFFEAMPLLNDKDWYYSDEHSAALLELAVAWHFDESGITRVTTYPVGQYEDGVKYDMTNGGMYLAPNISFRSIRKNM